MSRRAVAELATIGAWLGVSAAAVVVLTAVGRSGALSIEFGRLGVWLSSTQPEFVVAALLRVAALAVSLWVLTSTLLYVVALASRVPAAVKAVEWATVPVLRPSARRLVAAGLAAVTLVGAPRIASASVMQSPTPVSAEQSAGDPGNQVHGRPDSAWWPLLSDDAGGASGGGAQGAGPQYPVEQMPPESLEGDGEYLFADGDHVGDAHGDDGAAAPRAPGFASSMRSSPSIDGRNEGDDRSVGSSVSESASDERPGALGTGGVNDSAETGGSTMYTVVTGDTLWSISADAVAWGLPSSSVAQRTKEVAPYWLRVVEANRDRLRSGRPDLIFPGEVVELPEFG